MGTQRNIYDGAQQLFENLQLGVFRQTSGLTGVVIQANTIFCQMLGYTEQEITSRKVIDFFEDKDVYRQMIKTLSQRDAVSRMEAVLIRKDDRKLSCQLSLVVIKDRAGKVEFYDGIVEDVARRKRTEQELKESKELFRTVFNNSAAAIIVTDREKRIIAWNPFAETMLGMSKQDFFNKPVSELYPPDQWTQIQQRNIRRKGMDSDIETQIFCKDGSIIDVNMSISVIKDSEGGTVGSIGIMNDISRQKAAERKIKESENKIRTILDNSAVAITLTDEKEQIVSWNKYTEELFGYTNDDLLQKPVSELYPPEEWQLIRKADIRRLGSKHHFETKVIRKDGNLVDVDLSVNVLKNVNDEIVGSVGILQDITKQKEFQRMLIQAKTAAEEANSAKSLFLANMSHEVRTPMNTVMGMIDLTLDTALTDEQRENLSTAKDAADILLSLINDILDLSRVEAGKILLEKIELNIHNIVKSVCKGLSVLANNKKIELVGDIDSKIPETLIGDPVRIRQVLVNLINNAIKFTFQGKVEVTAQLKSENDQFCELLFFVKDQGIGIAKDKLDKIFSAFTQADESMTRRFGGSGLGLSISKRLVEMMDGQIWVESDEFKGSTFYFTARFDKGVARPAAKVEEPASQPAAAESAPAGIQRELSILLAEDNIVNQKMAAKMLEKKGWRVKTADNGKQVLDYLDKENFDVILMDAQMPVLDGFETTRMIRENEKKTGRKIPIVALTARAMASDRKRCLDSGMDGYVAKPIDRQKLYEAIEGLFKSV